MTGARRLRLALLVGLASLAALTLVQGLRPAAREALQPVDKPVKALSLSSLVPPPVEPGWPAPSPARVAPRPAPEDSPGGARSPRPDTTAEGLAALRCSAEGLPVPEARASALLRDRWDELVARLRAPIMDDSTRARAIAALTETTPSRAVVTPLLTAPDRTSDGFDLATNTALALAQRGLQDLARSGEVLELTRFVREHDPSEPLAPFLESWVHRRGGDREAALASLRDAAALAPEDEPAFLVPLGRLLLYQLGAPGEARAAFDAYLDAIPDDVAIRALRDLAIRREEAQRPLAALARDGITLRYPSSLPRSTAERIWSEVATALADAAELLGVQRRSTLSVNLYGTRAVLREVTCATGWTGAIFDGSLGLAYDLLRPEAEQAMIRHEVMHAALQDAVAERGLPYWFEEGLAQHFATDLHTPAYASWSRMVREEIYVPFPSLEGSFMVIEDGQDARLAYDQSLAMVLWMADRDPSVFARTVDVVRATQIGEQPALLPPDLTGEELVADIRERLPERGALGVD